MCAKCTVFSFLDAPNMVQRCNRNEFLFSPAVEWNPFVVWYVSELLVRNGFPDSIRFVFLLVYSVVLNETRDALALCHLYSFSLFVAF